MNGSSETLYIGSSSEISQLKIMGLGLGEYDDACRVDDERQADAGSAPVLALVHT